jgi:drug/metabolite transporter (DMT)-like permease
MTQNRLLDTRPRLMGWVALSVVYVVWGTTYLAIRVGVRHVPPLLFAGIRYVAAGAILYPIALRMASRRASTRRARRPSANEWIAGGVIGVVLLVAGNGGLSVAETSLPSGFAAVLVATVPLWMIVFARVLERDPITWRKALSLMGGLSGVAILVGGGAWTGRASGIVIVLGASVAWGFGSVLGRRLSLSSNVLFAAAIEMLIGGAVLLAVAAGSGEVSHFHWASVSSTTWIALVYLIGPGSILAFTAYSYALSHLSLTTVSTYAYVNPVVAVLAGTMFLGEHLTLHEIIGASLVLGSVIVVQLSSRDQPSASMVPVDGHDSGAAVELTISSGAFSGSTVE